MPLALTFPFEVVPVRWESVYRRNRFEISSYKSCLRHNPELVRIGIKPHLVAPSPNAFEYTLRFRCSQKHVRSLLVFSRPHPLTAKFLHMVIIVLHQILVIRKASSEHSFEAILPRPEPDYRLDTGGK